MSYTVFNSSGRILAIEDCLEAEMPAILLRLGGDGYILGHFSWDTYRVVQGEAVEFPPKPSARHQWDWTAQAWADQRTLAQAKIKKNTEIDSAREAANRSHFVFQSLQIAADDMSMKDILATNGDVQNLGSFVTGWPGGWKAMNGAGFVAIPDVATWHQFFRAMVTQGATNFEYSQQLKATLAAATTLAQVDAITW